MRNPLNGITGFTEIVNESLLRLRDRTTQFREHHSDVSQFLNDIEEQLKLDLDCLDALHHCAKHQNRIADDVLQLSKLSMKLVSVDQVPFDPIIETGRCIRMFEREANIKNVEVNLSIAHKFVELQISSVYGDPIRFAQVLINLLSNALRFTEKSPIRRIEIVLDADADESAILLRVSVTDSGIGLTKEEQTRLFQKFSQASPKTHIEYGGSGLGLFISKALVEAQGGKLSLESEKDKGTKFEFYIRVKRAHDEDCRTHSPRPYDRKAPGINVLVVEDNLVSQRSIDIGLIKINQKVLVRQLQNAGFQTAVANHGQECLEMVEHQSFNVILMDLEMPIMDGIATTVEIRRRNMHIPVIAVTGNARREYIERGTTRNRRVLISASSVGMNYFFTKPYDKKELIKKVLELSR